MELSRLRHILAVARTGSFSRAAEEERITQPALSRSIAAFEQRHGVLLFDRGRGGVHPTPAGKLVIERARKLLSASSDLERSLRLYGKGEAGRVALGIGPLMASLLLPGLAGSLLRERPGLQVSAIVRTPEQLLPDLLSDGIEMIIGHSWQTINAPGTETRGLATLPLTTMVRAGHPLAGKAGLTTADLAGFPVASAVEMPGTFGDLGGGFVCDNYHVLRDTVLRTDCVWLSSAAFVAPELAAGTLVRLPIADADAVNTHISITVRTGRTQSPAAIAVAMEIGRMLRSMSLATEQAATVL
jgi:LysR family transcriptional regulator, pca operon transcriptional activator